MRWSNLRNMVWPPVDFILVADFDAGDIQRMLSEDGYLRKLAKRVQTDAPSKRDGAIVALVALGNTGDTLGAGHHSVVFAGQKLKVTILVKAGVMEAIKREKTIHVLVARLNQKSNALSAASALAHLVGIGKSRWWVVTMVSLFIRLVR